MTIRSAKTTPSTPPSIPPALLSTYTNLASYIRTANPAPNGSQDLSKIHRGDIISLEGTPCKVTFISEYPTGRMTLVEGTSLLDDMPYAARFNHCYGIRVGTYSGRPEVRECVVVGIRETDRGTFISLQPTTSTSTSSSSPSPTCPNCHQPSPSSSKKPNLSPTTPRPFDLPLPATELGCSIHRQYNHSLRRACLRAFVLVSSWGSREEKGEEGEEGEEEEQEREERVKMLGFRLSTEREWHVAPGTSHWCEDCGVA